VLCRVANGDQTHQLFARDARLVVRALRTVGAILGTAARLYREEPAKLDFVGLVEGAVRELHLEYQMGSDDRCSEFRRAPSRGGFLCQEGKSSALFQELVRPSLIPSLRRWCRPCYWIWDCGRINLATHFFCSLAFA
jgi:hypothetical protein